MKIEFSRTVDDMDISDMSVFTREEGMHPYYKEGTVYQGHPYDGEYPEFGYTPVQARELAAALLRAADEAESGVSEEARLRTELAAIDDELRKAGIEYPLGARGVRDLASLFKVALERGSE